MPPSLEELAEDSMVFAPEAPGRELLRRERYVVLLGAARSINYVSRLRLGNRVDETVAEVRELLVARARAPAIWWVGGSATPPGLAERLVQLGLEPDPDDPVLRNMVLTEPPPAPRVDVRPVESLADFRAAHEIEWECWSVPEPERARLRRRLPELWERVEGSPALRLYLAQADGEPISAATASFGEHAGFLMGGTTLPYARGRGAYAALVHARWRDAVKRGTPVLVVQAGKMSAPILERLGFRTLGRIRLLRDVGGGPL